MTDYLTDEAVNLIRTRHEHKLENAAAAKPYFITMAYNAPHNPLQALKTDYYDEQLSSIANHKERVYAAMIMSLDRYFF
jgi:hypothetical protein